MRYLLDSVVLIDHLNGHSQASDFLFGHWKECSVSVITRAEVLAGFPQENWQLGQDFLRKFTTIPLTSAHADLAARLRRDRPWKLPDAFQAAVALAEDLKLTTRNTKDFDPSKDDFVLVPYEL